MGVNHRIPKAWDQIEENKKNIETKLEKGGFTGKADELMPKIERGLSVSKQYELKVRSNVAKWYKIADFTISQGGNKVSLELIGGAGYNADSALQQQCKTLITAISGNGSPKGLNISALNIGNSMIGGLSYYNFPDTDRYELFIKTASFLSEFKIVANMHNEDIGLKMMLEERDDSSAGSVGNRILPETVLTTGNCPISKGSNGYCKLANGMIMQWGVFQNCGVINGGTFNLPIAFSTTASAIAMNGAIASTNSVNTYFVTECRVSTTQITIKGMYSVNGEMRLVGMTDSYRWIAIGY